MANFSISSKEFTSATKSAKNELKGIFSNPFVVCNLLNKAAKGDFEKVADVQGITHENLAKVAKALKCAHGGRYAFEFNYLLSNSDLFRKDSCGRLCAVATCKSVPAYKFELIDIIPATNKTAAKFIYLRPVVCDRYAIFSAFAKVAKVDIKTTEKATEKAAKAAKKAAKESEKAYKAAQKCAVSDFNAGKITEVQLAEKLAEIKVKFGK